MDVNELPEIASRVFMGGRVVALSDDGSHALVRFRPPEGMRNPHGGVQGGFAAAMIDDVVSMATYHAGQQRTFVTANLNCYYLAPVPFDQALDVSCTLVKVGKRQAIYDAQITAGDSDKVLIRATQLQQFLN